MKKSKRLFAFVLSILTILTCFLPQVGAANCNAEYSSLPIVYVKGNASTKFFDKNGNRIWPLKKSMNKAISENMEALRNAGIKSYTLNNWNYLGDELVNTIGPLFEPILLDKNGNNVSGSYIEPNIIKEDKDGKYDIEQFCFKYDARLDPWEIAVSLRTYINQVLAATGKSKVNLLGRCMGTSIMAAYLTRYKSDTKVCSACFYSAGCNGVLIEEAPFVGDIEISSKSFSMLEDDDDESIASIVSAFTKIFGKEYGASIVNSIVKKALPAVLPRILRVAYANFPTYWSLIDDNYYRDAKDFIYGSASLKSDYAGLIKKIDYYHKNVFRKLNSTLTYLKEKKGVNISVITKYNVAFDPIYVGAERQGDNWIEGTARSFGATFANYGEKLPKSMCDALAEAGLGKYISSDRIIDASTALFPDTTWFVKNMKHSSWSTVTHPLIYAIFSKTTPVTVSTYANYPRFLMVKSGKLYNISDYVTSVKKTVESVSLSPTYYEYTGNNKTPTVKVLASDGSYLKKDRDFKVTYDSERASIGKHYATVKFIGNYTGTPSQKLSFKIYPASVSDLSVTASGTSAANVKWTAGKGATAYRVYTYNTAKSKWILEAETSKTSITLKNLDAGKNVKIAVRSVRYVGSTAYCSPDYISKIAYLTPLKPTLSVKTSKTAVSITWTAASGATQYEVYRSSLKNGVYRKIATQTSKTLKLNSTSRTYYYKVRAVKIVDKKTYNGSYSNIVSCKGVN